MLVSFLVPIMHVRSGFDSLYSYHKPLKTKSIKITWDFRSKSWDILKFSSKENSVHKARFNHKLGLPLKVRVGDYDTWIMM